MILSDVQHTLSLHKYNLVRQSHPNDIICMALFICVKHKTENTKYAMYIKINLLSHNNIFSLLTHNCINKNMSQAPHFIFTYTDGK